MQGRENVIEDGLFEINLKKSSVYTDEVWPNMDEVELDYDICMNGIWKNKNKIKKECEKKKEN